MLQSFRLCFSSHLLRQTDAARTWDILKAWSRIDIKALIGPNINTPLNCIFMTTAEHGFFGRFELYLEQYPDSPYKYKAHMTRNRYKLSNGQASADVQFRNPVESGIDAPDPDLIRVHAAFAKVLHLCGAAEYVDSVERDAEVVGCLRQDGSTDLGVLLMSRLAVTAY
ncbi:hypothetical protein BDQ12DRAFT_389414 [Crucibulum laeve]|uniref:HNH nuclease domain-containing protein n=1 Tax=Crucibulum laeve TaxID=68775 RepID=A0A5C3M839_9AGAR|nr:hypothetical protein BDQ12DRAFT_389414 [Crucibulum laeve]